MVKHFIFQASGDVYVWGSGDDGRLGVGDDVSSCSPTKLSVGAKVTHISCHYYHSALVTAAGKLLVFGSNEDGQLGLGKDIDSCPTPREVTGFDSKVKVAVCGSKVTVVITGRFCIQCEKYSFKSFWHLFH